MRIGTIITLLTSIVLAASMIHVGDCTVLAQLSGFGGHTFCTDQISITQGQVARLDVANTSRESLVLWLFFRDGADKVLVKKNVTIKPGASGTLQYSFTGPNNPLRAQFTTKEAESSGSLRPTLRIVEDSTGNTIRT